MYRLCNQIDKMLSLHECVIVPTVGAILKQTIPARYVAGEGAAYSAYEQFHFNGALHQRDGLLDDSYARSYKVSLYKARTMVDVDVDEFRHQLISNGKVSLPAIGSFSLTEEGLIQFLPEDQSSQLLGRGDSYGFTSCTLPYALSASRGEDAMEEIQSPLKSRYVLIPKRSISWVAAAAVLLLCFLPLGSDSVQHYFSAGIVPNIETPSYDARSTNREEDDSDKKESTQSLPELIAEQEVELALPKETPYDESIVAPQYYVIIASFRSQKKAASYIESLQNETFASSLGSVQRGRYNLVYAASFAHEGDAKAYAATLRLESNAYRECWVLHFDADKP